MLFGVDLRHMYKEETNRPKISFSMLAVLIIFFAICSNLYMLFLRQDLVGKGGGAAGFQLLGWVYGF